MKEKVVTVEKCHGCANGLRIKKTKQIMKHAQVTQPTPQRTPQLGPKASSLLPALSASRGHLLSH